MSVRRCTAAVAGLLAGALAVPAPALAAGGSSDRPLLGRTVDLVLRSTLASGSTAVAERAAVREGAEVSTRLPALRRTSVTVAAEDVGQVVAAVEQTGTATASVPAARSLHAVPDDSLYASAQAGYLDQVRAAEAWTREPGDPSVLIAVVDSGVDVGHPDLAGKVAGARNVVDGSSDVTDRVGHGTFVAGVAAAASDNGTGIAGAGFDSRLLAVKVRDDATGEIALPAEAAGIVWAADNGADVINLSLGGSDYDATEAEAVAYAQSRGAVVVASAGNDGTTAKTYPAALPGVIAVGATSGGARAGFSSYGPWVTVGAPGVGITSTVPAGGSQLSAGDALYSDSQGTSFAAPIVAGQVALLKAAKPSATVAELRKAVVDSASGFAGLGLGAGRVDLAGAFDRLAPTTMPTLMAPAAGTTVSGVVRMTARSSSPFVQFAVDGTRLGGPQPVVAGTAAGAWTSWGGADGPHAVQVADCTAAKVCGTAVTVPLRLDNPSPTITSPRPDAAVSGTFTATATAAGGGVAFLVDGRRRAFDATAPYGVVLNASELTDARHVLTAVSCATTPASCAGPTSAPVPVLARSLHPSLRAAGPSPISPNGDGRRDRATVTVRLAQAAASSWLVVDSRGVAVRTAPVRTLRAGDTSWTWDGRGNGGVRLADGTYTLRVHTSARVRGAVLRGMAARYVVLDTRAAPATALYPAPAVFHPYRDGYLDQFIAHVSAAEPVLYTLYVSNSRGVVVGKVQKRTTRPGRSAVGWYGRTATGALVPPGQLFYSLHTQDAAGNRARSQAFRLTLTDKRLVAKTAAVTQSGAQRIADGGSAACASADPAASAYQDGLRLLTTCAAGDYQEAGADWRFTLPAAVRYDSLQLEAYGRSAVVPSPLVGATYNVATGAWDAIGSGASTASSRWHRLSSPSVAQHVDGKVVTASVAVGSTDAGPSDFDVASVRLLVGYSVLA